MLPDSTGLVSILMPAYNAAGYIGAAIESVLAQTYPHWELIIVDDGSIDGTSDVVRQYTDPRIRLAGQANAGEAAARNHTLQLARGDYLAFLDSDDQFLAQHLELGVGYLKAHPERDGVYTDGYYIDSRGQRGQRLSQQRRGPFDGCLFEPLVRASDVFGPPLCVVIRREAVTRSGQLFDTEIVIGPDWDFFTRVSATATFGYLGQATCLYRVHQTNITLVAGATRRQLSLARCREKATQLPGFDGCSLETRDYVFYDLLVNLLTGLPDRQAAVTAGPAFKALPAERRARLYRLMASRSILSGLAADHVPAWLTQARTLHPADARGQWLERLYRLSPELCRLALGARARLSPPPKTTSPFGKALSADR